MKIVWLMLAFWTSTDVHPFTNPTAPRKAYDSKEACIADIPNAVNKDAAPGKWAIACIEGIAP